METTKLNILFVANDLYYLSLKTTLLSLIVNNDYSFSFYSMGDLSLKNRENLEIFVSEKGHTITFIDFKNISFDEYIDPNNFFYIGVRRLFAPFLIDVDKLLYIDSDLIINKDIKLLYNFNLENKLIGVVKDRGPKNYPFLQKYSLDNYYNSGVILFDSKAIREKLSLNQLFLSMKKIKGDMVYPDQDIMNILYYNEVCELPNTFNFQVFPKTVVEKELLISQCIVHFLWRKPWSKKYPFVNNKSRFFWKYGINTFGIFRYITIKMSQLLYASFFPILSKIKGMLRCTRSL